MSVTWELHCDRPGCTAVLTLTASDDRTSQRGLVAQAEQQRWQVVRWTEADIDLCPAHRQPELGDAPPLTDLSVRSEQGRAKR
jgi:hypothetical protein